jgi:hypothetical protein
MLKQKEKKRPTRERFGFFCCYEILLLSFNLGKKNSQELNDIIIYPQSKSVVYHR